MSLTSISVTFACKFCSVSFDTVAEFLDHKEASHFEEFINTKAIVFEERTDIICDVEYSSLPPLEIELDFIETDCENNLVENESSKESSQEAGTALFDANHVSPTGLVELQTTEPSSKNLIASPADESDSDSTIKLNNPPCLSSQTKKTASTIIEIESRDRENRLPLKKREMKLPELEREILSIAPSVSPSKKSKLNEKAQNNFHFQHKNRNTLPLPAPVPVQSKKKMPAQPNRQVLVPTEVRRSIRKKFVSCRLRKDSVPKKEVQVQNTQPQVEPLTEKKVATAKNTKGKNESRPQKASSMKKVPIASRPRKPPIDRKLERTLRSKRQSVVEEDETNYKSYPPKYHKCGVCSKAFNWRRSLLRHSETHKTLENRERPFKCVKCGKSFLLSYHLKDHLRRHSNQRPFKCPHSDCEKSFKTNTNLISHLKSHLNMRPFKCSVPNCSKAYRQKADLNEHIQTHTPTEECNYMCTFHPCTKRFMSDYKLKRHILRVHTKKKKVKARRTANAKVQSLRREK